MYSQFENVFNATSKKAKFTLHSNMRGYFVVDVCGCGCFMDESRFFVAAIKRVSKISLMLLLLFLHPTNKLTNKIQQNPCSFGCNWMNRPMNRKLVMRIKWFFFSSVFVVFRKKNKNWIERGLRTANNVIFFSYGRKRLWTINKMESTYGKN